MWNTINYDDFFAQILHQHFDPPPVVEGYGILSGGNISVAAELRANGQRFFVKWVETAPADLLPKEAAGLQCLAQTGTVRIPKIIGQGEAQGQQYLLLEYIQPIKPTTHTWTLLGQELATLHAHTQPQFGLDYDNYIGSLPQANTPTTDGIQFWITQRLHPQAGLALYEERLPTALYHQLEMLYEKLPDLLPRSKPALLHGDLWSGNVLADTQARPVLVDPSVHYGLREAEIAFTRLFGGFEPAFYAAYQEAFPMEDGFEQRYDLYQLYPLLVHLNLFGQGYLSGIRQIVQKYVG
jgi:fructosamine-3-kinase